MKVAKLEIEFTESENSCFHNGIFDRWPIARQISFINTLHEWVSSRPNRVGYDKTYFWVTLEDGSRPRVRFDIGCDVETIQEKLAENGMEVA